MANCTLGQTTYVDCRRHQAHEIVSAMCAVHAPISVIMTWPKKLACSKAKIDLVRLGSKMHGVLKVVLCSDTYSNEVTNCRVKMI